MKNIKTYIDESIFGGDAAEDIVKNVNDMLAIKNPPKTIRELLNYYCVWAGVLQSAIDLSFLNYISRKSTNSSLITNKEEIIKLPKTVLEIFKFNLPNQSIQIDAKGIDTISEESYTLESIPMTGWEQHWEDFFTPGQQPSSSDIDKIIEYIIQSILSVKQPDPGCVCGLIFDRSKLDFSHQSSLKWLIWGLYNCALRPSADKLHGDRSWKMNVRKECRQYFDNILNILSAEGTDQMDWFVKELKSRKRGISNIC